ncbi:hypothetical protein [Longimicrobium sp.]|uniref:hypothetical protein n=1 Tax=Longimicrobium sp. TaxID=2029185 RepID=UPI002ED805FA
MPAGVPGELSGKFDLTRRTEPQSRSARQPGDVMPALASYERVGRHDVFEKPELSLPAQHLLDAQLAEFDPNEIEALLALVRAADVG